MKQIQRTNSFVQNLKSPEFLKLNSEISLDLGLGLGINNDNDNNDNNNANERKNSTQLKEEENLNNNNNQLENKAKNNLKDLLSKEKIEEREREIERKKIEEELKNKNKKIFNVNDLPDIDGKLNKENILENFDNKNIGNSFIQVIDKKGKKNKVGKKKFCTLDFELGFKNHKENDNAPNEILEDLCEEDIVFNNLANKKSKEIKKNKFLESSNSSNIKSSSKKGKK